MPFLHALDWRTLDAEQRLRIGRMKTSLVRREEDLSMRQVAAWLTWDPRVWLTLLSRDDLAVRQTALAQLSLLLEIPPQFDPTAEPAVRHAQIEGLQKQLLPDERPR